MEKSLDAKLADIHAKADSAAFILADAKDADMAFGMAAPGKSPEHADGEFRSLEEYREHIRQNVRQKLLDIMLMSVSTNELLAIRERLFVHSPVTPAIRANDTTDIHLARGSAYSRTPALPFRTAVLDHARAAQGEHPGLPPLGADLGLYSLTFNNDAELDRRTLEAYRQFRIEAEQKGFRHFLEVFDPNAPVNPVPPELVGGFLNDLIVRTLAGVASPGRPLFLKIVYHGPKFLEELVHYDPHLVVGILGGASGTTYDAFKLLEEARRFGARAALFGRKINNAEHQLSFIQFLRWIADGQTTAEEAVRAYHGVLERLSIRPQRTLDEDMKLTNPALGCSGSTATVSIPPTVAQTATRRDAGTRRRGDAPTPRVPTRRESSRTPPTTDQPPDTSIPYPTKPDGSPDFARMTPEQRLAYHQDRLDRAIDGKGQPRKPRPGG